MNTIDGEPRCGRPRETTTRAAVNAVLRIIRRYLLGKQKIITEEMKNPPRATEYYREDHGLGHYRRSTDQRLSEALRQIRATRANK